MWMRRPILLLCLFCAAPAFAQEQVRLTTPETKITETWSIVRVDLLVERGTLVVRLKSNAGEALTAAYDPIGLIVNGQTRVPNTPTGQQLLVALNKADLSVKSLQRRIYERLIADGVFVGSVEGNPALTGGAR